MAKIAGLDTIKPENCPKLGSEVEVSESIISIEQIVLAVWFNLGISVIPYCTQCKMPLVWHTPADGDILFHCPLCERKWVMDSNWLIRMQPDTRIMLVRKVG
jgi:hypothetical protein